MLNDQMEDLFMKRLSGIFLSGALLLPMQLSHAVPRPDLSMSMGLLTVLGLGAYGVVKKLKKPAAGSALDSGAVTTAAPAIASFVPEAPKPLLTVPADAHVPVDSVRMSVPSSWQSTAKYVAVGAAITGGVYLAYLFRQKQKQHAYMNDLLDVLEKKYFSRVHCALGDVSTTCFFISEWRDCQRGHADALFWLHEYDLADDLQTVVRSLSADICAQDQFSGYRLVITDDHGDAINEPTWSDFFRMIQREKAEIGTDKKRLNDVCPMIETVFNSICASLSIPADDSAHWTLEQKQQVDARLKSSAYSRSVNLWWFLVQRYWRLQVLEDIVRKNLLSSVGMQPGYMSSGDQTKRILSSLIRDWKNNALSHVQRRDHVYVGGCLSDEEAPR
jgi:hypothetical protein